MGILDSLLKNVDTDKIKKSVNDLNEKVKNIDTSEIKDAFSKLTDAFPDDIKNMMKAETETHEKVDVDPVALHNVIENTDVSYATVDYTGIDKRDYNTWLPEDDIDCTLKIIEVVKADFPEYELKADVSPATIGGTGRFMNYSLGIYKDGQPKLFIMILVGNNYRLRTYRWSKEEAEKNHIPMINFIEASPNRYWYIKERLAKYI